MMDKSIRFMGVCILLSSVLICATVFANTFLNRYVPSNNNAVFDKLSGTYYVAIYSEEYQADTIYYRNWNPIKQTRSSEIKKYSGDKK